jgi:hypothetical protein
LVFEHVHPVSLVIRQLLADVPADEHALAAVLERAGEHVVITREEDAALAAAGYRNAVPGPAGGAATPPSGCGARTSRSGALRGCRGIWR